MLEWTFLGSCGSVQDRAACNTSLLFRAEHGCAAVDLSGNLDVVVNADPDAVILTHEHIDHVYGLPSLLHQLWLCGRQRPLELHFPKGMEPLVQGMLDLFGMEKKPRMFALRLCTEPDFKVGDLWFSLFHTDHTALSVGLVVEENNKKLVYTCDTRPWEHPLAVMQGACVLIHEASGPKEDRETLIKKGHSTASDAARLAQQLNVQCLYLCHLPAEQKQQEMILQDAKAIFEQTVLPPVLKPLSWPAPCKEQ